MTQERKDFLLLHFIVLIWGFTAILGLLISVSPVEVVFYRTAISAVALFFLLKFRKRNFHFSSPADLMKILATGVLIAAHWILFFLSARISNASVCLAGMATCSLWTSLLEPLVKRKKIRGFEVLLSILAFAGIAIIFNVEFDYLAGLLIAVFSAFIASVFTIINGHYASKYNPYMITFYEMLGAAGCILVFYPVSLHYFSFLGLPMQPTIMDWIYLAILAVVCTVYAYSVSVELMKRLSAFSVNLVVNLEPVYGILLALIIFGSSEKMSTGFYFGTLLILSSVLMYPILNRRYKKRALLTDLIR
ncbi:MAG: DMT family transporter [Bacteroidota bacterium]